MTEWLRAKKRLLLCTQVIAHTYYIMSHQARLNQLAYIYLAKVCGYTN